jgi:hypothetical protein
MLVRLQDQVQRMPDRRIRRIAGIDVPEVAIEPFHSSAPIKIEFALRNGVALA